MKRMQRLLCVLLLLGMVFGLCPAGAAEPDRLMIYGDLNFDEVINPTDALLVLQHTVELCKLSEEQRKAANTNADDTVDASDALQILQFTVSLLNRFPVQLQNEVNQSMTYGKSPFTPNGSEVYARDYPALDASGIRSTFQMGASYSDLYAVPSDSVMVYVTAAADSSINLLKKWQDEHGKRELCLMLNSKGIGSFLTEWGGTEDELQMNASGNFSGFADMCIFTVPTENYTNFVWDIIDYHCSRVEVKFIALEEPDYNRESGYSKAFKAEWKAYYGEDWIDPASSAEASYKASKLKTYLYARMFSTIGKRLDEQYPDVKLIVATHSILSYNRNEMIPGLNQYASLKEVDGIIGQTWSNTIAVPIPYGGAMQTRLFESAYLGYASFADAVREDQLLYTLSDPYADFGSSDWEYYESTWRKAVTAQLLLPQVHRFQESIWLDRSFSSDTPGTYRTVQLSAFHALNELSGKEVTVYGGTPGIAVGLSDSVGWQNGYQYMASANTSDGIYGLTLPLVERGIPMSFVSLDRLTDLSQLSGVKVLLLSYDIMKPLSEQCNQVLADWVKTGGVLLYAGGLNGFDDMQSQWWGAKGETPLQNLISHLGLDVTYSPLERFDMTTWCGKQGYCSSVSDQFIMGVMEDYAIKFDGGHAIINAGSDAVGIDEQVGLGRFIAVGLPSAYFSSQEMGPQMLRELVEYAVSHTELSYVESDLLAARRGDFLAAQALGADQTIAGQYIDVYDPKLPVVTSKTLNAGDSALLRDISGLLDQDSPVLAHHGATLLSEVTQTKEKTEFTFHSVSKTTCAFRLLGNGHLPQSVTLKQGDRELVCTATWDAESKSLLVETAPLNADSIVMTVVWGGTEIGDGIYLQ